MIYITGDTHRDFYRIHDIEKNKDILLLNQVHLPNKSQIHLPKGEGVGSLWG